MFNLNIAALQETGEIKEVNTTVVNTCSGLMLVTPLGDNQEFPGKFYNLEKQKATVGGKIVTFPSVTQLHR